MSESKKHRNHPWRLTLLAGLLAAQFAVAQPTTPVAIDILAQPLAAALAKFAEQSGLKTLYAAELLAGKTAPRVQGQLSPAAALQQLLAGTGLRYRPVGNDAIAIEAIPAGEESATRLRPVTVSANGVNAPQGSYAVPVASTGTKTDTPLIETPVAVTVIPQQVLKDQQVTKLEQALTNSSGVFAYSVGQGCNGTCEVINMRGFSSFTPALKDGLAVPTAGGLANMSNVESVEVMKGPASILYGRLEPGGVVNVVTKKPASTAAYSVEQAVGTHRTLLTNLDATGPIDAEKALLYRVIASLDSQHALYSGQTNGRTFLAPSLQWNAGPRTQLLMEASYTKDKVASLLENNPVDPATGETVQLPPSGNRNPSLQFTESTAVKLGLTHGFNADWTLKVQFVDGRSRLHTDDNSFSIVGFTQVGSGWTVDRALSLTKGFTNTRTADVNLTGHFDTGPVKHTLLLGADNTKIKSSSNSGNNIDAAAGDYVRDTTDAFNPAAPAPGQTANTWWDTQAVDTRRGIYIQDQMNLPNDVHVLAGLRHSRVRYEAQDVVSGVFVTDFGVAPLSVKPTRNDSAITPRIGVLWEAVKGTSLYASYSENFGAFQAAFDYQGNALDPQLAKQFEIGAKRQSADGKLSASIAVFDIRKTNEAIPDPDHTGCRGGYSGVVDPANDCSKAAGKTRSKGVELDFAGEVSAGWNVLANYTYTDARIVDNGGQFGEGGRLGYFPRNMARLASTFAFAPGWKIGGGATLIGATDLGNTSGTNNTVTPGYTVYDAMAAFEFKLGANKAALQLNVKNLLDKRYLVTAAKNPFFSTTPHGDPRSVLLRFRLDF